MGTQNVTQEMEKRVALANAACSAFYFISCVIFCIPTQYSCLLAIVISKKVAKLTGKKCSTHSEISHQVLPPSAVRSTLAILLPWPDHAYPLISTWVAPFSGFTLDPETGLHMAEVTGMSYIAGDFAKSTLSHVTEGLKAWWEWIRACVSGGRSLAHLLQWYKASRLLWLRLLRHNDIFY